MTLKPIEIEFSERMLAELKVQETVFDLSLNSKIIDRFLPKMILKELELKHNPEQDVTPVTISGWNFECFQNLKAAQNKYPPFPQIPGRPFEVYRFLNSGHPSILIDFSPIGSVALSKNSLETHSGKEKWDHLLPIWLSYALSPELWGPPGKWTRFHSRLHGVLESKGLLNGGDFPGYYPLKPIAKKLESFGFTGTSLENSYVLILPWAFSLSALTKLEHVILQEF